MEVQDFIRGDEANRAKRAQENESSRGHKENKATQRQGKYAGKHYRKPF